MSSTVMLPALSSLGHELMTVEETLKYSLDFCTFSLCSLLSKGLFNNCSFSTYGKGFQKSGIVQLMFLKNLGSSLLC